MAFKPGSNQRDYTLCSQYDDALDLPEVPTLAADADAEAIAARDAIAKDRAHRLKVARETANFDTLIKPGKRPTFFHCRHIPGWAMDWWHGQNVGDVEKQALLFRLALKTIENLGDVKMVHGEQDGQRLLSTASLDALYSIGDGLGRKVVGELAGIIAAKTFRGVDPLS